MERRLDAFQSGSRACPMRGHHANIAERAVGLTATVRVRGPDPRGDVAADAAFFAHHRPDDDRLPGADGAPIVAISATALRIPTRASTRRDGPPAADDDRERFIAPLAPFLPFLAARDEEARDDRPRFIAPLASPLAPGVEVHVRLGREGLGDDEHEPGGWTRARVLASCVPRDASNAVDALAGPVGLGALRRGWTAGGVAPLGDSPPVPLGAAVTGVVLIETETNNARRTTPPPPPPPEWTDAGWVNGFVRAGSPIVACGSPFAALSPAHFACAVFGGHVARAWGRRGRGRREAEGSGDAPGGDAPGVDPPLLMADVVALPGMEGAPVLDAVGGGVIGVLTPPLVRLGRVRDGTMRAEESAPLVLTMASIRDALRELVDGSPRGESPRVESPLASGPASSSSSSSSFRDASNPLDAVVRGSVVVLETDGGASWASGVVIGVHGGGGEGEGGRATQPTDADQALVLTNAHVVHPSSTAAGGDGKGPFVRSIRVGIPGTTTWRDAAPVYVSRGPLDVAVVAVALGGDGPTDDAERLVPVKRRRLPGAALPGVLAGAPAGSPVAVVGFARVGPGAIDAGFVDCSPAVHLGAVSSVVNFSHPRFAPSRWRDGTPSVPSMYQTTTTTTTVPAMYQTTASVHSGASGGAVVCPEDGTLLGLVTSNARLGAGGRVIPNLNFSIPVELLDPVFATAAAKGTRDWARAFEGCLEGLDESDELRSIWSLRDPASRGGEGPISKL